MPLPRFERIRPWATWPLLLLLAVLAIEIPVICRWRSEPAPNGSLLAGGTLSVDGVMGFPNFALEGPLAVEGSNWRRLDRALVLGNRGGFLAIDLREPAAARALLVQATPDDQFDVEGSLDGETWRRIWTVPEVAEGRGMRTRHQIFDPPESFRHLRIRNRSAEGVAALGAVRAYSEIPAGWPMVGPAAPARISGFPWLDPIAVALAKTLVALVGALLLLASWWLDRKGARRTTLAGIVRVSLAVTAGISALGWWNFFQISSQDYERSYYNYWDVAHYYLGAKYAPELGYTGLYQCMLAADVEAGLGDARLLVNWVRDLASNEWVRTREVAQHSEACTDRFDADRWKSFQADQAKFRLLIPPGRQLEILQDHGYNGTPVWGIAGSAVGALGPASDATIAVAMALDPILLVLTFALIATTFGFRATCGALILFGANNSIGNWFTGGAFLRFDWLAASVAGVCCLKRKHWSLAGLSLALATSLRLFPGFLIGGVGLHALAQMIRERRLLPAPSMLRFAAAVLVGILALASLSIAVIGNAGIWQGFLDNSIKHKATTSASNLGLDASTNLLHDTQRDGHERFTNSVKRARGCRHEWAEAAAAVGRGRLDLPAARAGGPARGALGVRDPRSVLAPVRIGPHLLLLQLRDPVRAARDASSRPRDSLCDPDRVVGLVRSGVRLRGHLPVQLVERRPRALFLLGPGSLCDRSGADAVARSGSVSSRGPR